ncbi:BRCA1-A complex subunit RAP80 isoform X3 [Cottoperca gobio]|uniref:BRCA1-A complex subunit RAP80 isoform X3 n=1 Tax=Cottoperca gobio TaxID=56716 RepID=A0A6J2QXQ7_COTGO|nr:BRCA1-A complex subunit RAP80 isoform X3 [Cottoperca gobio]
MRGRRGHSPSSSSSSSACFVSLLVNVSQEQTSMALRKQILKDAGDIPSGSQRIDLNTQEDEALDDNEELLSSSSSSSSSSSRSREKRKREKESKSKPNEMTEEEMMDLALRLSEQEASVTALRLQQEEEAMMKAIQESIVSQTQPCPPSQSPSPLNDAEASLRLCSRRKLLYSNRKFACAVSQGASEDVCTPETDLNRDESNDGSKKRKRKEGSPLLEMPDLSQTQKISCQASPCSSDCVSAPLDSPQSSDSTLIDECQLHKSPVFPSTGCRAEVHVPRLSQDLLQTCRTSGFVLCSQESLTSTLKSPPAQPKSPTFPKSLKYSNNFTLSRSPVFSETDRGDNGAGLTERSPEYFKSPVFGRNTQHETSASACKPKVSSSGFMFSSQESLTPSVRSTSCRSKSPVFPKSPGLSTNPPSPERSATCKSPVFPEADGGQTEQSRGCCTSPVIGRTGGRQKVDVDVQNHSESPSAAELRGSDGEGNPTTTRDPSQSLRQDRGTDHTASASDDAEELNEISKNGNSAETAPTSNMVLVWSEEDDDVTPVGSPSPVFPEEKPLHQADSEAASLNHVTAASPGVNCRPSTSSTSTGRLQLPTTEQEPRPISSQGTDSRASAPPRDPAGGPTVHYYWGVPFCPRGLDPDKYTQVIMAQMEVYEKSLKQAQRCLLRKAEWGEAVLPQLEKSPSPESRAESPQQLVPRRRGLRLKGKKLCEEADSCPAEEEDEKEDEEERVSKEEEEKKERGGEEGHVDTDDDCEVCPETQLSAIDDDRTQDLMLPTNTGAESDCKMSREQPEVEMILRVDSPSEAELQDDEEEMEVEADVDRKAKRSVPVISSDVGGQHVTKEDVEEIKDRGLQRSTSPELEAAAGPQSSDTKVDCPICQGSFPVTQIERHAAYCDGEVDDRRPEKDCFQVSLKPRKKRTRTAEASAEETNKPSNTGKNQEKCYICQKAVPLRDYSRHTELCIQRQASKTAAKGNLLSALQQTESRDSEAGPSGSKLQLGEVIDLRDDDDEDDDEEEGGSVSLLRISNSPIRSFTPISEATGCLIDFKKQHRAKKLRQRRR